MEYILNIKYLPYALIHRINNKKYKYIFSTTFNLLKPIEC